MGGKIALFLTHLKPTFIGSYGGYMTGIMASRHADKFKCGILLNPVVNIPFNLNITGKTGLFFPSSLSRFDFVDIPEWCSAESFGTGIGKWNFTGEDYKKMFE